MRRETLAERSRKLYNDAAWNFYMYAIKKAVLTILGVVALNLIIVGYWVPTYLPAPSVGGGPGIAIDLMVILWSLAVLYFTNADLRAEKKEREEEARRDIERLRHYRR